MDTFPEGELKLGHCLGYIIDVVPSMMAKILTKNGQLFHRPTYRLLNQEDTSDQEAHDKFMARVYERLYTSVLLRYLKKGQS